MAIAQVITFDTWSPSMYHLMVAVSPYVFLYYFFVALLGASAPRAARLPSTHSMRALSTSTYHP